jgi:hypothetical protein
MFSTLNLGFGSVCVEGIDGMPRFAAILASLLLIASSIGVNIARYPMVGAMVEGLEDMQASRSVAAPPAPETTETTAAVAGGQCPPSDRQRPAQTDLRPEPQAQADLSDQRPERQAQPDLRPGPLVPVIVSSWEKEKGPPELCAADGEVRRLPPVDRMVPVSTVPGGASLDLATANYPRTATP